MFLHSAIIDVFGTSWGLFEFVCLLTIVTIVSLLGVQVIQSNFIRDGRAGKLKTSLGGDGRAIYNVVVRALDASAANSARSQDNENESPVAVPDIADTIRRNAENEIEARGIRPSQELIDKVINRTAEQIGLTVRNQDTGQPTKISRLLRHRQGEETVTVTPFKTVDVRLHSAGVSSQQASSSVKITIVDGVLPDSISLPFYTRVKVKREAMEEDEERDRERERKSDDEEVPELATSYWPPESNVLDSGGDSPQGSEMVFDDIYVDSLRSGILIYYDHRGGGASLLGLNRRIYLEIEAYRGKDNGSRVLLYSGRVRVGSPLPELKEIISCKDLIVLRMEDPASPHQKMVWYSEGTLNKRYMTEYPHHMPQLTREAAEATDAFARVVDNAAGNFTHPSDDRAKGDADAAETDKVLDRPTVALIYGNGTSVDILTYDLYINIIKPCLEPDKYTTLPAERIGIMRDPSRPSDRYMCISVARTSVPAGSILIGWVVGFQDTGIFSRDGGYNIVFPANRSNDGYSSVFFDEVSTTGERKVVVHNTDNYVGCFGNDEDLPLPSIDLIHKWDGPVNGERYFSYHLRPCVLVRQRAGMPPEIAAIMCSPATEYAGQHTGLLPRQLAIPGGPLPLIQEDRDLPLFDAVMQGGGPVTFEKDKCPERLWAIFPTLRTKTRMVHEIDRPFAPLYNLLSRNRTSILSVKKLVIKMANGGHAVLRAFDEKTGTTLGRAVVPISNGTATPSVLFADCARDDRSISIDAVIFGCDDKQMPVRLCGSLSGQFLEMTAPENPYQLWHEPGSFKPNPDLITLSSKRTTVVICRTTHPPITDTGKREPFRKLSGLVPFPSLTPRWAFLGGINNKFPRHIFVSSVRNSETVNTIKRSEGKPFSVGDWLRENLRLPAAGDKTSKDSNEYAEGQTAYARMYLGSEVTDMALDQIIDGDNRACIVSENGTVKETLLKNDEHGSSRLVGDWGIAFFGSNPHPSEPADRFSVWRTAGRLRVVLDGIAQPVTPLQNSLSTWPNGDPVIKTRGGETLLRLDPRIGGVCSANGLYNVMTSDPSKITSSLLMVVIKSETGMVLYAKRLPLWCKVVDRESENDITDGLRLVDRGSAAQRRLWNRTTFDNDELILCVRIPRDIVHNVQSATVIVDHLIFACSASVLPASARDECYQRFVSGNPDDVLFDSLQEGFSLSVPLNFSTVCGFTL